MTIKFLVYDGSRWEPDAWRMEVEADNVQAAALAVWGPRAQVHDVDGHYRYPDPERSFLVFKCRNRAKDQRVTLGWVKPILPPIE